MERLVLLHEKIVPEGFQKDVDAFIAFIGKDTKKTAFQLAYDFRKQGISVEMEYENKSLKTQLKKADKLGAKYAIIVGEEELARGKVKVRNMGSSSEEEIDIDKVKQLSIKFSN